MKQLFYGSRKEAIKLNELTENEIVCIFEGKEYSIEECKKEIEKNNKEDNQKNK